MTRELQKQEEDAALRAALALMSLAPDDIRPREEPDFELQFGERVVGVEMVSYSASKQARQREGLWVQLRDVIRSVRMENRLPKCRIRLSFVGEWPPPRRDHRTFAEELCEWARTLCADDIPGPRRMRPPRGKQCFQTLEYIEFETVDFWMDWDWNGNFAWIGTQEHELQQLLAVKVEKKWPENYDERWLIIYGGATVGRMTSLIEDEIFDFTQLTADLKGSPFARLIITGSFGSDRAFCWTRSRGWEAGKTPYEIHTASEA